MINEDYGTRPAPEEPIWELAEALACEMPDFADGLYEAYDTVEELESLAAGEDWDEDEAEQ